MILEELADEVTQFLAQKSNPGLEMLRAEDDVDYGSQSYQY